MNLRNFLIDAQVQGVNRIKHLVYLKYVDIQYVTQSLLHVIQILTWISHFSWCHSCRQQTVQWRKSTHILCGALIKLTENEPVSVERRRSKRKNETETVTTESFTVHLGARSASFSGDFLIDNFHLSAEISSIFHLAWCFDYVVFFLEKRNATFNFTNHQQKNEINNVIVQRRYDGRFFTANCPTRA